MMGGFLFLFPAIQLSGVMAPLENIPAAVVPFSWLNPLRFFVALMRHLMLKGTIGSLYWTNLGALALLALGAGAWSVHRFRRTTPMLLAMATNATRFDAAAAGFE
jgi:ABC-2 type transport system permease protein